MKSCKTKIDNKEKGTNLNIARKDKTDYSTKVIKSLIENIESSIQTINARLSKLESEK